MRAGEQKPFTSQQRRVSRLPTGGMDRTPAAIDRRSTEFRHQRQERLTDEVPRPHSGMGDFQSGLVETKFPDQQKIEIEGSRLAARATSSTETCFDSPFTKSHFPITSHPTPQSTKPSKSQNDSEPKAPRDSSTASSIASPKLRPCRLISTFTNQSYWFDEHTLLIRNAVSISPNFLAFFALFCG